MLEFSSRNTKWVWCPVYKSNLGTQRQGLSRANFLVRLVISESPRDSLALPSQAQGKDKDLNYYSAHTAQNDASANYNPECQWAQTKHNKLNPGLQ